MRVAVEICKLMDRNPDMTMSDLRKVLPVTYATPTMSPYCADEEKYAVLDRIVAKLCAKPTRPNPLRDAQSNRSLPSTARA